MGNQYINYIKKEKINYTDDIIRFQKGKYNLTRL